MTLDEKYSGKKYNRVTIISFSHKDKSGHSMFFVKCDCGNEFITDGQRVRSGKTKSCGCYAKEVFRKVGDRVRTNGISKTKIYRAWQDMKYRCYEPNNIKYHRYGGRGIKVCDEWLSNVMNFYNWSLINGYKNGLTIDRINVNGNYEPENCRWADKKTQANNTSTNKYIEHNGERLTYEEWGNRLGACKGFIWNRINMGWNEIDAVTIPPKKTWSRKHKIHNK